MRLGDTQRDLRATVLSDLTFLESLPSSPPGMLQWIARLQDANQIRLTSVGGYRCRNPDDPNSAHLAMWQGDTQSNLRATVLSELVDRVMHRPAFHQLRTVEQIGYLVWTYSTQLAEVPHIAFLLQSTVLNAEEIGTRVSAFLQQWRDSFEVRDV